MWRDSSIVVLDGALVTLGSGAEERLRLAHLLGTAPTDGYLLRTPSLLTPGLSSDSARRSTTTALLLFRPEALVVRNSALATPGNDGALWAGRGTNVLARGGVGIRVGRVTAILVPEIAYAQNLGYQSTATGPTGQFPSTGPWQTPWYTGPYSADLPLRFGDQSYSTLSWGQSAAYLTTGSVAAGVSTENQWWGPGERSALLLSAAAEGVPHVFVRTAHPLRTRVGDVEGRWILGGLTPSIYFARPKGRPQRRNLNGAVATLRFRGEPGLTLGLARLVLTPGGSPAGHALDVVLRNDNLGTGDSLTTPLRSDQLTAVFGRWVFPKAGAELYGEFARLELPRSVRDMLLNPMNTGAFTLGLARAWPLQRARAVRAQLEVTNLEQSRTFTDRPPPPDYYTGRAAPAGWTNRGQVLGAATGPGSSSQWAAIDYYAPSWEVGAFAQRSRYANDALYRQFLANLCRHDVALGWGVRGGVRLPALDVRASLTAANRLNYLFQNGCAYTFGLGTVDVRNLSLSLHLSPRTPRGRP